MFHKIVFVAVAMFVVASAEPRPSGIIGTIGTVGVAPVGIATNIAAGPAGIAAGPIGVAPAVASIGIAAPLGIAAAPIGIGAPLGIIGGHGILG